MIMHCGHKDSWGVVITGQEGVSEIWEQLCVEQLLELLLADMCLFCALYEGISEICRKGAP